MVFFFFSFNKIRASSTSLSLNQLPLLVLYNHKNRCIINKENKTFLLFVVVYINSTCYHSFLCSVKVNCNIDKWRSVCNYISYHLQLQQISNYNSSRRKKNKKEPNQVQWQELSLTLLKPVQESSHEI